MPSYFAVDFFRECPRLSRADIAGNDDHRLIGRIEAAIEPDRVIARQLFHFVTPADHWLAVGMIEVKRRVDLLAQSSARIVANALVLLLEDNIALGQNDVVGELQ